MKPTKRVTDAVEKAQDILAHYVEQAELRFTSIGQLLVPRIGWGRALSGFWLLGMRFTREAVAVTLSN
jgi:hypothetical protein